MIDKNVRLKVTILVFSIILLGCNTIERSLLFQENTQTEEQEKIKNKKQEPQSDERKVLEKIEKNLENVTLNINILSDENIKTFEKITSKVNKLEDAVARLQIALSKKEEIDKKDLNQSNGSNQLGREDYQAAFEFLKEGKYEEARNSFIAFIELYQDSEFIDDAKYWLAETYYAQRAYGKALDEFESIQIQFPDSGKIPEAILKTGFCNFELGNFQQAKQILNLVTDQYPNTSVARLAIQKLKIINSTLK